MSKKLAIVLIVAAFLVGVIGGGGAVSYSWARFFTLYCAVSETSHAGLTLGTLNRLRMNDATNSIEALEVSLDGSLVMMGATANHIPKSERDKELTVLRNAKAYRAKFPRKSDSPEYDQAVSDAFLLVGTNK